MGVANAVRCLCEVCRCMLEIRYSMTPCTGPYSYQDTSRGREEVPVRAAREASGRSHLLSGVQGRTGRTDTFPETFV